MNFKIVCWRQKLIDITLYNYKYYKYNITNINWLILHYNIDYNTILINIVWIKKKKLFHGSTSFVSLPGRLLLLLLILDQEGLTFMGEALSTWLIMNDRILLFRTFKPQLHYSLITLPFIENREEVICWSSNFCIEVNFETRFPRFVI